MWNTINARSAALHLPCLISWPAGCIAVEAVPFDSLGCLCLEEAHNPTLSLSLFSRGQPNAWPVSLCSTHGVLIGLRMLHTCLLHYWKFPLCVPISHLTGRLHCCYMFTTLQFWLILNMSLTLTCTSGLFSVWLFLGSLRPHYSFCPNLLWHSSCAFEKPVLQSVLKAIGVMASGLPNMARRKRKWKLSFNKHISESQLFCSRKLFNRS